MSCPECDSLRTALARVKVLTSPGIGLEDYQVLAQISRVVRDTALSTDTDQWLADRLEQAKAEIREENRLERECWRERVEQARQEGRREARDQLAGELVEASAQARQEGRGEVARDEVLQLARAMEQALQAHDEDRGSDGWVGDEAYDLLDRLKEEVAELEAVIDNDQNEHIADPRAVLKECADVSNFAMMIFDVVRHYALAEPGQCPKCGGDFMSTKDEKSGKVLRWCGDCGAESGQKEAPIIIKGPLPGEAVEAYLKEHGHLPNEAPGNCALCAEPGQED